MSFAVLLLVFNALIFQERTFELNAIEWIAVLVGHFGIAHLNITVPHWTGYFLKAGIAGFLSSMLLGMLEHDLPGSIVLYGAGSGAISYLCAMMFLRYLRQPDNIIPAIGSLIVGLLGGLWTFGLPDVLDTDWTTPDVVTLGSLILIGFAAAVILLDFEFVDPGFIPSIGLIIVAVALQIAGGVLTVVGLGIGLLIVVVLGLMVWYIIMNSPRSNKGVENDYQQPMTRGFMWGGLIVAGLVLGWVLKDIGIVAVLIIGGYGLLWLPLVSSLLGFRAFVELADEEII